MKTIKKSFASASAKPVDVEYRLKRFQESIESAGIFIQAIDAKCFPDAHSAIIDKLEEIKVLLAKASAVAPKKKSRTKLVELDQAAE